MSRNRLTSETSPYLLQHKDNPVHWWPWGREALDEAERTGKPILLSVGYAACHWCHVMAHESFEDDATAEVMNELFVNVKVDREERPDIDAIYMSALHSLGEHGGWPLTMFLTPDARPFWGGTYFPKDAKFGRPGFSHVLREVSRIFHEEPDKVAQNATAILERLQPGSGEGGETQFGEAFLAAAAGRLVDVMDPTRGGIQGTPKFPQSSFLEYMWKAGLRFGLAPCLDAIDTTLVNICQGGIYDHLGGGFARYSVDDRWLVPHFEKMLYDNAQLVALMTEVWRERRAPLLAQRIEETVDWLMREMIAEGGGFASSLDADSEGVEGKFYVWSADEVEQVLGQEDAAFFNAVYDISPGGNWEGTSIPNRLSSLELLSDADEARLADARVKLLERRATRVRPGWDDKVLADWNGLMIAALARASEAFGRADWLGAAERAYGFITEAMVRDGRLLHAYRAGEAKAPANAGDYANMIAAARALYGATGNDSYIEDCVHWTEVLDRHYWSSELAGYHFSADDTDDVIVRTRTGHDDATPNANGVMLSNLIGLWLVTGDARYHARAEELLQAFAGDVTRNPLAFASLATGAMDLFAPQHIVIIAPEGRPQARAMTEGLNALSLPGSVVQVLEEEAAIPHTSPAAGKTAIDGAATAYVCIGPQCSAPLTDAAQLPEMLRTLRAAEPAAA